LCVVGESGCGKSTVARTVMGLLSPSAGKIHYEGRRIDNLERKASLPYRRKMQMIFQNPYASLNPRMTIQQTLEEPIRFHHPEWSATEVRDKIHEVMHSVGIDPDWGSRFGHEFSGGQRQRMAIARALAVDPEFIVADEPISALDVSIQAQVLNLLMDAQESRGLTYLFITHDLAVVEHFGTRVAVMYLGRVCELADTKTLFATPRHPYTQALLIASGAAPYRYGDDQAWHFQGYGPFLHWTGLTGREHCWLLIRPGQTPVLWLYEPVDFWHAHQPLPDEPWLQAVEVHSSQSPKAPELERDNGLAVIGDPALLAGLPGDINPEKLLRALDETRVHKTAYEVECLARANTVALAGHRAAQDAFVNGESEFGISLAY